MKKTKKVENKLYTETPSVFAVSYKEIARRQFFAGFVSGLGESLATVLVGFTVTVIIAGFISPRVDSILTTISTTLERTRLMSTPLPEK
ncbi:MAG: hypothetical protein ABI758_00930 [Candidatus Woesebacteria bacterium]